MDPITPVAASAIAPASLAAPTSAGSAASARDFMAALQDALGRVDGAQNRAEELAKAYQMGAPGVTLESSMVAISEANVSLQFAVQVRNRLVNAYHDIMNMPV